ncbi:TIGR03118 family protein [Scleromatobacter humisilvae]|uniref:TIGR03118 family protein n=1 Tax=Scleromatobacter humisilvae TaxID=2897159 RepID=A0A9X1YEU5_9BURK|nr:TIGR03118 family protein [Scleromatobacter humisilvae]MCK9684165.1 TIGR03118 family protein [Scleromatobacter humisilvae]
MSTSTINRPLPLAFVIAASALLAACGGSDSGGMTAAPTPPAGSGQTCTTDIYGTRTCTPTTGTGFGGAGGGNYVANALVSDTAATNALHHDANLVNAWGLVFNPQGFSWIANAGTGTSTLYDGNGVAQSLVVTLPTGTDASGIVFNGTTDFSITEAGVSGAAPFIFATLQGQIAAWAPNVDGTHAFTIVDNSTSGAVYTGLAIDTGTGGDMIYAADFVKGTVDVFSGAFAPVTTAGGFVDSTLPTGYAPFGIQQIGDKIYVTYAQPDPVTHEKTGAGLGLVDVFDKQGNLLSHLIPAGGALNAPWGLAMAPANFGKFSSMLLVGNFGDGKINVYDPTTGAFVATVSNNDGSAIVVPGLWALQFGNDLNSQPSNTLFYTAGPGAEAHGLYGRIDMN